MSSIGDVGLWAAFFSGDGAGAEARCAMSAWVVWAMAVAMGWDRRFGEPPVTVHPVVGMGALLTRMTPWVAPKATRVSSDGFDAHAWGRGTLGWWVGAAVSVTIAWVLQSGLLVAVDTLSQHVEGLLGVTHPISARATPHALLVQLTIMAVFAGGLGILLKPLLAWRMLREEVAAVGAALDVSLAAGRERLSWLCSRDTTALSADEVRETAIETLAENLSDSVVAPLFWFVVAGLPGAALYRWANTADAMWGYRGERHGRLWTWAGHFAAKADDLLSYLPARLTGGCIRWAGPRTSVSYAQWRQQARLTPSPNGGWPMSAMALGLGVSLGKPGVYRLNEAASAPTAEHLPRAIALASRALWWAVGCLVGVSAVWGFLLLIGA